MYNGPAPIRTPLLPSNSVLIREVSFGEREHHMHSQLAAKNFVSFLEGCPLYTVSFKRGTTVCVDSVHSTTRHSILVQFPRVLHRLSYKVTCDRFRL